MDFHSSSFNELFLIKPKAEDVSEEIGSIFDTDLTTLKPGLLMGFTTTVVILCTASICGNFGALYANQKRKLRIFFRTCLTSLAFSDLIQTIFMSVAYLAQFGAPFVQVWYLGDFMCSFIPFVTTGAILVGSMTLVGIAMDRYFAVKGTILGSWNPGKTFCSIFALGTWALAYGIASPILSAYSTYQVNILTDRVDERDDFEMMELNIVKMCASEKKSNAYYYIVVLAIIFIPTLVAFIWLNTIIANKLWIRRHSISTQSSSPPPGPTEPVTPTTTSLSAAVGSCRKAEEKQIEMTQQQYGQHSTCLCHDGNKFRSYTTLTVPTSIAATTTTAVTTKLQANNMKFNSNAGGNNANNSTKHISSREARHLRMFAIVLILMAVFIFFRLPAWVFLIMRMYGTYTRPVHWILHFSFGVLTLTSCVLNPLLYTFLAETIQYTILIKRKICGLKHYFKRCGMMLGSGFCCSFNDDEDNEKMSQIQEEFKNANGNENDCKDGTINDGAKSSSMKSDDDSNAKVYIIVPVLKN